MDVGGLFDDDYKVPLPVVRKIKLELDELSLGEQSFGEILDSFEEPPEHDYDEGVDYAIGESDASNMILDELNLINYDDLEKSLSEIPDERSKKLKLNKKLADGTAYGADRISVINGSHSLISHMMIKSGGKIVYNSNNLHKVTFVKNLSEYSDDYARSIAKKSLWYLDTSADVRAPAADRTVNTGFEARSLLTTANNDVNVIIPLNRYAFFEELEGRMLPPMQLEFNLTLQNDDEILVSTGLAGDGSADGRVVLDRFFIWVPHWNQKIH
ncbi:hypothetical protein AWC38_SpisGene11449 [Stylophora pistillata]|uniref:Uncharacterized protein n=1 Tax=Stylophora pistillata TaxID=50429 RepID=A0A2B4S5A7_STYPI|nr:hypothetical protein AWC38_SpisGene11449 [Stylophora pistillata]